MKGQSGQNLQQVKPVASSLDLNETATKQVYSPAESCGAAMASKCEVVFSMLAADAALESVFGDYLSGKPKKGSVYIDCSTVYPDLAQRLEAEASAAGITYLACPIVGRPDATLAKKALVISSGDPAAKAKVGFCPSRKQSTSLES